MITISQDNKKNKKLRLDSKFWTRLIVALLVGSMLIGTLYSIIISIISSASVKVSAEGITGIDDFKVRIAVLYGSNTAVDFRADANNGFEVGYTDGNHDFTAVFKADNKRLDITNDINLALSSDRYIKAGNETSTKLGAYHIEFPYSLENEALLRAEYPDMLLFKGIYGGEKKLMLGHYFSHEKADKHLSELIFENTPETLPETTQPETSSPETTSPSETTPDESLPEDGAVETNATGEDTNIGGGSVTEEIPSVDSTEHSKNEPNDSETSTLDTDPPAATEPPSEIYLLLKSAKASTANEKTMCVVDIETNTILFEYNGNDTSFIALRAVQVDGSHSYIYGYKKTTRYTFDDVLECSFYQTDEVYGIKVVNILPIETYITGVIPYEVSNTWPLETQKAFSIAVRSFAISRIGYHKKSYNSDLCSGSNCQVYKGFGSTNDRVRQAVLETKGQIAVYNGRICITTYSSSTGGCTANSSDVWGSNQSYYGYLVAVPTPWEKYESHANGSWTSSATGKQIYQTLVSKGYTALKYDVADIEITKLGNNSSYVYEIKFTDTKGNTLTVKQGNKVKSCLSPYLNSGNFVVAKAGETVQRVNYSYPGFGSEWGGVTEGIDVLAVPNGANIKGTAPLSVITSNGIKSFSPTPSEFVLSVGGRQEINMSKLLDAHYYPTISGVNGEKLPDVLNLDRIKTTETLKAEGSSNTFVFIGRGWGHGVGLSQWGIHDMAKLGYDYKTIFNAYYVGANIISFTDYLNNN